MVEIVLGMERIMIIVEKKRYKWKSTVCKLLGPTVHFALVDSERMLNVAVRKVIKRL